MRPSLFPLVAVALSGLSQALAASFTITDGKLQVLSSLGTVVAVHDFALPDPPKPTSLKLRTSDVLRLTFTLNVPSSSDGESDRVPSQLFAHFTSSSPSLSSAVPPRTFSSPIKVRKSGKARYELTLSLRETPASLLSLSPSDGKVALSLLIGDVDVDTFPPTKAKLAELEIAEELRVKWPEWEGPTEWETERFGKRDEIRWTFRGKERQVNSVVALLGVGVTLAPWVLLLGAINHVQPKLVSATPRFLAFLATLGVFEGLIFTYWTSLKLLQVLPWFGALGVVAFLTGREALSEIKKRNLAGGSERKDQ